MFKIKETNLWNIQTLSGLALFIFLAVFGASCAGTIATQSQENEVTVDFVGSLSVSSTKAPVGASVTISGTGFGSNQQLDLMWHTVEGSWDIRGEFQEEYHGRVFDQVKYRIAEVQTDASGNFNKQISVPEDYGFNHNITVERNNEVLNRTGFKIEPSIAIEPKSGPMGTPITITLYGIGWQAFENSWTLMYDNNYTGFLSAVTTKGTAKVVIPAAGLPGKHVIKVMTGAYQYPYLNGEQDPFDQPIFTTGFDITDGPVVLLQPVAEQGLPVQNATKPSDTNEPVIWTKTANGPINTNTALYGVNFPAGETVQLNWFSIVGNRVSGSGWDEIVTDIGSVAVQSDGTFSFSLEIPDDLGGNHRIEAVVSGEKVAETNFKVTTSAMPLSIESGQVGDQLTINLKGVGWTETANIYMLVYDNSYLGYACGFNSQGDITINLPLVGNVGWHFIDLYPGIYKGKEVGGVQNFRIPQLTYQEDHPGEKLPAFHFAVEVIEYSS